MELKQLSYFVAVVEEGSFSAAARKLFMSQPPITTQVKALEEELGCALLVRGTRAVRLTEEGRLLYDRARLMLEMRRSVTEEIEARSISGGGTLRLGVVSSVASSLLPGWLSGFHALNPKVRLELYEDNTYELLEKLRAGMVEAALVRTPFPGEQFSALPLSEERLVAVGLPEYFAGEKETVLEELAGRPLMVYRRWEQVVRRLFAEKGLPLRYLCISDSSSTIAALAEQGLGVGLLPESGALRLREPAKVCRIRDGSVGTTIVAVTMPHAELSIYAQDFLKYMEENARTPLH